MSGRRSTTTAARGAVAAAAGGGAPANDRDLLSIVPLGAGQEVGRSCIIVKYQLSLGRRDGRRACGGGFLGFATLPFFSLSLSLNPGHSHALPSHPAPPPPSARGKTIMLDCGIHPGLSGLSSLPFFDEVDLDTVDLMLVRRETERERERMDREKPTRFSHQKNLIDFFFFFSLPFRSRTSTWTTAPPCPTWSATPTSRAAS